MRESGPRTLELLSRMIFPSKPLLHYWQCKDRYTAILRNRNYSKTVEHKKRRSKIVLRPFWEIGGIKPRITSKRFSHILCFFRNFFYFLNPEIFTLSSRFCYYFLFLNYFLNEVKSFVIMKFVMCQFLVLVFGRLSEDI